MEEENNQYQEPEILDNNGFNLPLVKNLLINSYKMPQVQDKKINNYFRDDSLSGQRAQVYYNPTGKAYLIHRGTNTIQDVGTDAQLLFGFKNNARFKHGREIAKEAKEKYGQDNITSIGHSLGASIAERHGKKHSSQIITVNKPTLPLDIINKKRVPDNQYDIKNRNDPISLLKRYELGGKKKVLVGPNDPLDAHSIDYINF